MQIMPAVETLAPQTADAQHLTELLHAAFPVALRRPQSHAPGPAWLQADDAEYLQVTGAGLASEYDNNQRFWLTCESIKVGQTSLLFLQRQQMLPPLDVRYTYAVNVVEQ